jgi:hypothetical protein
MITRKTLTVGAPQLKLIRSWFSPRAMARTASLNSGSAPIQAPLQIFLALGDDFVVFWFHSKCSMLDILILMQK